MCNVHFSYLLGCGVSGEGGVGVLGIGSYVWGVSVVWEVICGVWGVKCGVWGVRSGV